MEIPAAATREQRVHAIAHMMAAGEWLGGYTLRVRIAETWGCAEATIRDYAAEAHRLVSFNPQQREELRSSLAAKMQAIAEDAFARSNEVTGLPDYRAAIDAYERFGKYAGIDLDADGPDAAPPKIVIQYADSEESADVARSDAGPAESPAVKGTPGTPDP